MNNPYFINVDGWFLIEFTYECTSCYFRWKGHKGPQPPCRQCGCHWAKIIEEETK